MSLSSVGRENVVRGKIAVVTGGAQGFGEEIVRGLFESGATVWIADLNEAGARRLAEELNARATAGSAKTPHARENAGIEGVVLSAGGHGMGLGRAEAAPVNVSDEASVSTLFETIANISGGLDLCVSNAGILKAASLLEQDLAAFKLVTDVNYTGFFLVAKHAAKVMKATRSGRSGWRGDIIQINSKSGLEGSNKNASYAGGKFGGIGLVQSFALELVEYGIKVNAICPGNFFDGPLWSDPEKGLFVQYLRAGKVPGAKTIADVKSFYEAKVPMRRGCTGADVMRALYYIVEQEYETGQAVPVTGGQVMLK